MSRTLSARYRPTQFRDLVGQNPIRITLENEIANERIAHAYLFCGPRGVGKTTTARLLAKAVNCRNRKKGEAEPCNACTVCESIQAGANLDIIEIDAASHTGVDHVRDQVIANARVAPSFQTYKVFIIDEVHMLSTSAFNALLKTLEEPPDHALFILATTEVHKLPETIISRCQRFDFRKVGYEDLIHRLEFLAQQENVQVQPEVFERIARFSGGHVRDAESLLWQIFSLGKSTIDQEQVDLFLPRSSLQSVLSFTLSLLGKDAPQAMTELNQQMDEGTDIAQFLTETIEVLRKLMLVKVHENLDRFSLIDIPQDELKKLRQAVDQTSIEDLVSLLDLLLRAHERMEDFSHLPQLPIELAIVEHAEKKIASPIMPSVVNPVETAGVPASSQPPMMEESSDISLEEPQYIPVPEGENAQSTAPGYDPQWAVVVEKLKILNASLALSAGLAKVERKGSVLEMHLGYKFHCDRLMQTENKTAIEAAVSDVYGEKMSIDCIWQREAPRPTGAQTVSVVNPDSGTDQELVTALDVFGGKIIPKKPPTPPQEKPQS